MIILDRVTKHFDAVVAIENLSCEFSRGQTHVLLGSSGCGKSTLLRLILGSIAPDSGSVRVDGRAMEAASRKELLATMGYVVQEGGLYPHLSARSNVSLAAEARGWSVDRTAQRIDELMALVGFDAPIMQKYPHELSGGQRQRVGLMRALLLDPPILLLDEPLGSLDPLVRDGLQVQLREIFRALGKTVILVTHDIREAAMLGQTVSLMTEGRLVQQGTFRDLVTQPASDFVRAFFQAQKPPPDMKSYF